MIQLGLICSKIGDKWFTKKVPKRNFQGQNRSKSVKILVKWIDKRVKINQFQSKIDQNEVKM